VVLYESMMDNLILLYRTTKRERCVASIDGFEIWIVRERLQLMSTYRKLNFATVVWEQIEYLCCTLKSNLAL
jgi:hypothetical protein